MMRQSILRFIFFTFKWEKDAKETSSRESFCSMCSLWEFDRCAGKGPFSARSWEVAELPEVADSCRSSTELRWSVAPGCGLIGMKNMSNIEFVLNNGQR
jgi:hypothetical protein